MHNDLTNLLPPEHRNALSRDYLLRLGIVIMMFVAMLTLASMILLLPTYVFLTGSAGAKEEHLANIESEFSSADDVMLSARLAVLSNNVAALTSLHDTLFISTIIREALNIPRPGITLSSLSYARVTGKSVDTLMLSGVSATRTVLRNYQLAFQNAPFVSSAVLPVSAYAKDTDISFTITITIAP